MPRRFPPLKLRELRAILEARGFVCVRVDGSHQQWAGMWAGRPRVVTLDGKYDDIGGDILRSMIRQSGMTRDEFYESTPGTARKIR